MLLLALIAVPLIAAAITFFASGKDSDANARLGLFLSLAIAALGIPLITSAPNLSVSLPWFTLWGTSATVNLSLASDGLSAWLIQLVTWLTPVAILGSRSSIKTGMREFVACVFIMQALMIGALLARDLVVFYFCYEAMLLPMLVIILLFGGDDRRQSSLWFFLYTMAGSVMMLVGIWYLAWKLGTTDLAAVVAGMRALPADVQGWLFWAFVLAFAVKVPMVPLHGWQARTYADTPGAAVVLLAGAMAKIGTYGFLRFVLPIFPVQSAEHAGLFIALGLVATIGGALVAMAQDDAKRMMAYSSLSHLGLVMVGIFTFDPAALNGAAVQMVAHGFSVAALFLLIGYVEARTKLTGVEDFGGLANQTPILATLFVTAALASAALPGTLNFIGEFQLLAGLFATKGLWITALAGLSVILGVVYLLVLIQRWFFGKARGHTEPLVDLGPGEVLAVLPLLLLSFFLGFYPAPVADQAGKVAERLGLSARDAAAALTVVETPAPATALVTDGR
jgi:NADH-quinone oxidoreductase subunit M